jgi:hypothetical protein
MVPATSYPRVEQAAVIVKGTKQPALARHGYDLPGKEARRVVDAP